MPVKVQGKSNEEIMTAIESLDLDPIKFKLMHPEEGKGLTLDMVNHIERRYRQFLFLTVTSGQSITPTREIDEFWHTHILDTKKYFDDCESAFGFYLHHLPYFGIRSDDDASNLQHAFAVTQGLWEETFGESLFDDAGGVNLTCNSCGGSCSACSSIGVDDDLMQVNWRPSLDVTAP